MKKLTKRGLLIHSYSNNEPNWLHTVWGYPPDQPGRLVTGVKVILEEDIDVALICGTSGGKEGEYEGWWMKNILYQCLEYLKSFTIYPIFHDYTADELRVVLNRVLVIKEKDTAANTAGEVEYAGRFFTEVGVGKVIIVSCPDNVSRCIRDALACWREDYPLLAANTFTTASWTLYSERTSEDKEIAKLSNVVIAEPPIMRKFNLARMFGVLGNPQALSEIDVVLKKHGK